MAAGIADDLATTALLATDKPVLVAPAMNVRMWEHAATAANVATLKSRGMKFVGPTPGAMACGEFGMGRMAEPVEILAAIRAALKPADLPLSGVRVLVTSGPTQEAIDPVRFISNRSSGKQGHAHCPPPSQAWAPRPSWSAALPPSRPLPGCRSSECNPRRRCSLPAGRRFPSTSLSAPPP